jgi:TetR/AcrR family transcriptional regulator, cholesterol catabolism regulator
LAPVLSSPPINPALRARYELRRQEVINTTARVFAERGYQATLIDDLVTATGLTRGGLYHYIASKQELLFSILDELIDPLLERARSIISTPAPPEEHLRQVTRVWLNHIASHRDHMIVFNQERGILERDRRWEHVQIARRSFEEILEGILQRGQEDGSFKMRDPQLALLALLGAVNYTPQWFASSGRLKPEEIADVYCDVLLDGIRPR